MHTLKEVSERCRKTENDVLRMAVNDEIVFFVRLTCPVQEQESGRVPDDGRTTRINDAVGFVPVENHYIEDLLSGETAVDVGCFHTPGMTYFPLNDSGDDLHPFEITRERLMVTRQELARIEQPVMPGKGDGQKKTPDKDRIESKTPFTQAIEKVYRHLHDRGEFDALRDGSIDDFIKKLADIVKRDQIPGSEHSDLSSYVRARISKVTIKKNGALTITTDDFDRPGPSATTNMRATENYEKIALSKKLCRLRKKYSIPE